MSYVGLGEWWGRYHEDGVEPESSSLMAAAGLKGLFGVKVKVYS